MTGSVFNNLMGQTQPATPEVGMGATRLMWTDRVAVTVVEVSKNGKRLVVQEDKATRTDNHGMSDSQSYAYEPNPHGRKGAYTLRKNGTWVREGSPMRNGERLLVGSRNHYHDYSF